MLQLFCLYQVMLTYVGAYLVLLKPYEGQLLSTLLNNASPPQQHIDPSTIPSAHRPTLDARFA